MPFSKELCDKMLIGDSKGIPISGVARRIPGTTRKVDHGAFINRRRVRSGVGGTTPQVFSLRLGGRDG